MICKMSLALLSPRTVHTVTNSFVTSALLTQLLLVKTYRSLYALFQSVKLFFASSRSKFHVLTSGWTEHFKQAHRHYLILDSDQILSNFLLRFAFNNLTHIFCSMTISRTSIFDTFCKNL